MNRDRAVNTTAGSERIVATPAVVVVRAGPHTCRRAPGPLYRRVARRPQTNDIQMTIKHIFTAGSFIKLASLSACLLLALAACDSETGDDSGETGDTGETGETGDEMSLALVGDYTDEYGDNHTITADQWENAAGGFAITQWSNEEQWLVAQNAATNMYFPDMWSRFDWAWDGEQLYYCQAVYDGATVDDALAGSADAADLMAGCGGFAWTKLDPA